MLLRKVQTTLGDTVLLPFLPSVRPVNVIVTVSVNCSWSL